VNILHAMADPALWQRRFRDPKTFAAWHVFLAALFGLPMTEEQRKVFEACTGRKVAPSTPFNEAWLCCGRRSGKSFILALIAIFLATLRDWTPYLSPGERGTVLVLANDRRQARAIMRYARALLLEVPLLADLVERETAEELELSNRVTIEISTASFRTTRGYTVIAALCDEIAFWHRDDSANPDTEILDALRPAMATVPGAMLLCASSPYAKRGAMWDSFRRWHGRDGAPVLFFKAPTSTMNPTVPQRVIDEAYERDPAAAAAAEWGAEFRSDIASFVQREVIDAAIEPGRHELPPMSTLRYVAHVDASGGSSDSFTCCIAHAERDGPHTVAVVDAVREIAPPFSPESAVNDIAALVKSYRIHRVSGDRYAGEFPRELFRKHGIEYALADKSASDMYRELLPLLNSGRVQLLDHSKLANQLCGLERRTARAGRDSISHPPGQHDDLATAVAGACLAVSGGDATALERFRALAS
jgi:hypothetical protein